MPRRDRKADAMEREEGWKKSEDKGWEEVRVEEKEKEAENETIGGWYVYVRVCVC